MKALAYTWAKLIHSMISFIQEIILTGLLTPYFFFLASFTLVFSETEFFQNFYRMTISHLMKASHYFCSHEFSFLSQKKK